MKVLIIDDDQFIRSVFTSQFTQENIFAITAVDGEEGFTKAVAEEPDVVILDLILPKQDGFELLEKLRKHPALRGTKRVVFSGLGQEHDKQEALTAGADAYFSKDEDTIGKVVDWVRALSTK